MGEPDGQHIWPGDDCFEYRKKGGELWILPNEDTDWVKLVKRNRLFYFLVEPFTKHELNSVRLSLCDYERIGSGLCRKGAACRYLHLEPEHVEFELDARVDTAARGLLDRGLAKGDRVGCWLPNLAEYIVLQYATARIGAILVTLNPAYRAPELAHALSLSGCRAIGVYCPAAQLAQASLVPLSIAMVPSAQNVHVDMPSVE